MTLKRCVLLCLILRARWKKTNGWKNAMSRHASLASSLSCSNLQPTPRSLVMRAVFSVRLHRQPRQKSLKPWRVRVWSRQLLLRSLASQRPRTCSPSRMQLPSWLLRLPMYL